MVLKGLALEKNSWKHWCNLTFQIGHGSNGSNHHLRNMCFGITDDTALMTHSEARPSQSGAEIWTAFCLGSQNIWHSNLYNLLRSQLCLWLGSSISSGAPIPKKGSWTHHGRLLPATITPLVLMQNLSLVDFECTLHSSFLIRLLQFACASQLTRPAEHLGRPRLLLRVNCMQLHPLELKIPSCSSQAANVSIALMVEHSNEGAVWATWRCSAWRLLWLARQQGAKLSWEHSGQFFVRLKGDQSGTNFPFNSHVVSKRGNF